MAAPPPASPTATAGLTSDPEPAHDGPSALISNRRCTRRSDAPCARLSVSGRDYQYALGLGSPLDGIVGYQVFFRPTTCEGINRQMDTSNEINPPCGNRKRRHKGKNEPGTAFSKTRKEEA